MALTLTPIGTRRHAMMLALPLVALLLPTAPTTLVSAQERVTLNFASIRTHIIDSSLPPRHQSSFLARVDAAETALLLPAVQSARDAARRNDCASVHIINGLRQYNQALSNRLGDIFAARDVAAIDRDIDDLLGALGSPECPAQS